MKDFIVYGLFLVAGLLVGGAWTMWKDGSRLGAVICAVLAVIAGAGGILWMISQMQT